ncbi:hypothetical protein ACWC9Q_17785 [Streptomyces sp. NPDC001142]
MFYRDLVEVLGTVAEGIGVAVIAVGSFAALVPYLVGTVPRPEGRRRWETGAGAGHPLRSSARGARPAVNTPSYGRTATSVRRARPGVPGIP